MTKLPFELSFRRNSVSVSINAYEVHELLGTRIRALFQRRRGRDLFDLHRALEHATPPVDPSAVVESFLYYLIKEKSKAGRQEFIDILKEHLSTPAFRSHTAPLLRSGVDCDPNHAGDIVRTKLLQLLPEG